MEKYRGGEREYGAVRKRKSENNEQESSRKSNQEKNITTKTEKKSKKKLEGKERADLSKEEAEMQVSTSDVCRPSPPIPSGP